MVGVVLFVVLVVAVVHRFDFVIVVVEHRMLVLVGPSHVQLAFWQYLLLKLPKPIYLS